MVPKPHKFSALTNPSETRLLELYPAKTTTQLLSGGLRVVNLDDEHDYEALSYEWGSMELTQKLYLDDGSYVAITESLFHALRDIRHERSERLIWADGLCINQSNLKEREQQVSSMGFIFRRAKSVITYIGPESEDSAIGIELADKLGQCGKVWLGPGHAYDASDGLPPETDPAWKAVRKLMLRGWVGRCWCAQEFVLNRKLVVRCGRQDLSDKYLIAKVFDLAVGGRIPRACLPDSKEDPKSLRECHKTLALLRRQLILAPRIKMHTVLNLLHPLRATDPRDKIYSILTLTDKELEVDYTCTVEDLYNRVAAIIVNDTSSLAILYDNLLKKDLKLPSWVPDWSTWQYGTRGTVLGVGYAASGNVKADVKVIPEEKILEATGCLVDRVTWLGSPVGEHYSGSFKYEEDSSQRDWLKKQRSAFRKEVSNIAGDGDDLEDYKGGADDTLWRCLVGNITLNEEEASEVYRGHFFAHIKCNDNSSKVVKDMANEFHDAVRRRSRYKRLGFTETRYFGSLPETAEVGDWICMLYGGKHMYVVRECDRGFRYIGHAYVDGLMKGQCLNMAGLQPRRIQLV